MLIALVVLTSCAPAPAGVPASSPAAVAAPGAEREVWRLVNEARARSGCAALVWSDAAAGVARAHSADMARRGYFDHASPEGIQPAQRLSAAAVTWSRVAENIAHTPGGAESAVRMWMGSSGHRTNILNCAYTHTGVGEAAGRWTQLFYTPRA